MKVNNKRSAAEPNYVAIMFSARSNRRRHYTDANSIEIGKQGTVPVPANTPNVYIEYRVLMQIAYVRKRQEIVV